MKKDILLFFLCLLSTGVFSQLNITATAAQDTICQGESVALQVGGDVFDSYIWTPATGLNNTTSTNPTATPPMTNTYTVTGKVLGNNVIDNGDFSQGSTGFSTDYLYGPDVGGPFGVLSEEGTYIVTDDPSLAHDAFSACGDHTSGFGNMLVVNGASDVNAKVWCQTITVLPNTTYEFSTWITSVEGSNPAQLQFSTNGSLLGTVFSAPSEACEWGQFFEIWESGNNTSIEICIVNQNVISNGNDFALDDISFSPILSASASVTVFVSDISGVVATQSPIGCDGSMGTAALAINGGYPPYSYLWDNGETAEQATNLSEGNHAVTVTDAVGCAAIVNVYIAAAQAVVIDDVVVEQTSCGLENGVLEIFAGSGTPPFQYSIDGMNFQNEAIFENVAPGTFFVVIEDANDCSGAFQVTVDESEAVEVEIATPFGVDFCSEEPVVLEATGFAAYLWSTGDTTSTIVPTESGAYSVVVTDDNGCTASASIMLEDCETTEPGKWEMPNVFTPNDDGVNDFFGPVIKNDVAEILDFKIFNRWGGVVHNAKIPWDGMVGGKPHTSGVLVYIIQLKTKNGIETLSGDVTLIR